MEGYDAATYGDRIAGIYDGLPEVRAQDTEGAVRFLTELAGSGPVLELGIGTGRLALRLVARGLEVHGIDASKAMVARLRAVPRGDRVTVTVADFTDAPAPAHGYRLVFVAFNTFFALRDQDAQVRCLQGVADVLGPGGRFVAETFVPDLGRFDRNQRVWVRPGGIGVDHVDVGFEEHDPVAQSITGQRVVIREGRMHLLYPIRLRYAWPSELDLMARLAGLRLEARFGGWDRAPFGASSDRAVSVYRGARD